VNNNYNTTNVDKLFISMLSNNMQSNECLNLLNKLGMLNNNQNYCFIMNLLGRNMIPNNSSTNVSSGSSVITHNSPDESNFTMMVNRLCNLGQNNNQNQVNTQPTTSSFNPNINPTDPKNIIKIYNDFLHSNEITPRNFFNSNPTTPNNFGLINSFFNQGVLEVNTPQNNNIHHLNQQFSSAFKAQMTPNNLLNLSSPMGNTTSPQFLQPQSSMTFSEMVNLRKKVFG